MCIVVCLAARVKYSRFMEASRWLYLAAICALPLALPWSAGLFAAVASSSYFGALGAVALVCFLLAIVFPIVVTNALPVKPPAGTTAAGVDRPVGSHSRVQDWLTSILDARQGRGAGDGGSAT